MFRVMDGNPQVLPYLHHFDRYHRCDEILAWLIKNRLTGKEFIAWVKDLYPHLTFLSVGHYILSKLKKDNRPIVYGKDMI